MDRDLIGQYVDQLRLSLRIPEVGRILVEAEDHLREAAAEGMAAGLTEAQAQRAAIARFGPVHAIVYAHQTRHGRMAAMLADLGIALWRVAAFYLLAFSALNLLNIGMGDGLPADVTQCAATGAAGLILVAAYFTIRHALRSRGRVWSLPIGGYFPLTAAVASAAVMVGSLMMITTHVVTERPATVAAVICVAALGLVASYGTRMLRMLLSQEQLNQEHPGPGELA